MRNIQIPLYHLLEIIVCAGDYGYADDVLMSALAQWLEFLTDEEIAEYARSYLNQPFPNDKYTQEDVSIIIARLKKFRKYWKLPRLIKN